MGMESFFINIRIPKEHNKDFIEFNNSLSVLLDSINYKTKQINPNFFLVNELIDIKLYETDSFYEMHLMGCFSCYELSCNMINDLTCIFCEYFNATLLQIGGERIDISKNVVYQNYIEIINKEYEKMYQWFRNNLTDKIINTSPSDFYNKLKRKK